MTNFLESLSFGIQVAKDRYRNFIEIHDLFILLKEQIEAFSKDKVTIELYGETGDFFKILDENPEVLYQSKLLYLCCASQPDEVFHDLTSITFNNDGYPCSMIIDGDNFDAYDKISLEKNIKKLLESPSTGQKIFDL
ncbi:MAG TPA: hypothetical protein DCQ68_00240, partial [Chryseobacterium indologenes]|nr:hypothetical protein [Chryseobacterium indologenes]